MSRKIAVLAGDGIGPEIMESTLEVLEKVSQIEKLAFDYQPRSFGGVAIDKTGEPLPAETLETCQSADAILLGSIGGPKWEQLAYTPEKGLLALRKALQLYANIRPIKVMPALAHLSPLKSSIAVGCDFVVVRELTSGIYFGEPRLLQTDHALDTNCYQRQEIEQIIRKAFEVARTRKGRITSIDKANVLATSKLWRQVAEEIALEFPDCTLNHQYVDSAAMKMITSPEAFDVIVTENLFGDILSDEASVLPGSLGLLPSGSYSLQGPSLYEPIHGSAPDIAGKNIANPMSMLLSAAMMLRQSFQAEQAADRIEDSCNQVMAKGILTRDLGGNATTSEFTKAVIRQVADYKR